MKSSADQPSFATPVFIAGPTAVGKSEVAIRLAERIGGEIVSVDSMQVYRGLDIGTAKPSIEERARVPHHLIDVIEISDSFDAARFIALAQEAATGIQSRGRMPVFCGGTGLYFKAFIEGLGTAPSSDAALRAQLEAAPLAELLRELAERDPVTYEKIDRHNRRRVSRAIEVIRLTGRTYSEQRASWRATPPAALRGCVAAREPGLRCAVHGFGLLRSKEDLHARINARVEEMFQRGLVSETAHLLERGLAENRTALQALGYRQVVEHLRGERTLEDTVELVKVRTRQFARRQMTWFRRQLNLTWVELRPGSDLNDAVDRVLGILSGGGGR